MAEPRDGALRAARLGNPPVLLAAREHVAADVEIPTRFARRPAPESASAKTESRNSAFHPVRGVKRGDFPHGLVVVVGARVVDLQEVVLHARRVDLEDVRVLMIVRGVERRSDTRSLGGALPRRPRPSRRSAISRIDISTATYRYRSSYATRTVVRSVGGIMLSGSSWRKSEIDAGAHPRFVVDAAVDANGRSVAPMRSAWSSLPTLSCAAGSPC